MPLFFAITAVAFLLSSIAGMAADALLSDRIAIFGSFVGLQYGLNPGIAWGIRLPSVLQNLLILLALIAVGWLAHRSLTLKTTSYKLSAISYQLQAISYGFILGGGLSNVVDRARDGFVTDFIQIGSFPVFNIADTFVSVGVVILMLEMFISKRNAQD